MSPAPREPTGDPTRLTADVLVVGSGAGGAPTAAILAEAGFDVVVLEEGPLVRQGDVTPFSLEQMDRQYRAGGVTAAIGLPSIAYTEGVLRGRRHRGQQRALPATARGGPRPLAPRPRAGRLRLRRALPDLRRGRAGAVRADRARGPDGRPARRCAAAPPRSDGATTRSPAGWTTPAGPTPGRAGGAA